MVSLDELTEKDKQEVIDNLTDEGANFLRLAIIQSARTQYIQNAIDGIDNENLESFFDSVWFDHLCEGCGMEVARRIRKEAKKGIKPKKSFAR